MSAQDMHVEVSNLRCGACERTVINGLSTLDGVSDVSADHEMKIVSLRAEPAMRQAIVNKLQSMGFPEKIGV